MRFAGIITIMAMGLALSTAAPPPARADDDGCHAGIGRQQAIAIARSVGLVRVEEVECDDDEWEVEGWDARGREIEVEIDARTGRIKEVDRD